MENTLNIKEWYLSQFNDFEKRLNGESEGSIHLLRKDALNNFSKLDFPTLKDEEWKYTNITPLLKHNFVTSFDDTDIPAEKIKSKLLIEDEHSLLVFINGYFSAKHSDLNKLPKGVIASSLAKAIKNNLSNSKDYLGKYADYNDYIFTALSTAFIRDGAFIYIPDGVIVEEPIHILFITTSENKKLLVQPRNLFVAGKNSQAMIIEHYAGAEDSVYFTNAVTEIRADENAVLDHIKLQEESNSSFHFARMEVDLERSSNFTSHTVSTGSSITRNDFNSRFNDEGGECTLNGLYMIEDSQLFDTHTLIDHAKPHCVSHEHYKGILDDTSRGVFNGKVMVRQDAQKTNAFQENNNILLSDKALVNTKPQLEIFADDVKCSHGATIGQLDDDAMFYLKTRGIGEESAKAILMHAFASDVITSIKNKSVRDHFEKIISQRFNK